MFRPPELINFNLAIVGNEKEKFVKGLTNKRAHFTIKPWPTDGALDFIALCPADLSDFNECLKAIGDTKIPAHFFLFNRGNADLGAFCNLLSASYNTHNYQKLQNTAVEDILYPELCLQRAKQERVNCPLNHEISKLSLR